MKKDYGEITQENVADCVDKIVIWLHNQVQGAHRKGVVIGMSGGVDCSVVARLCQLAGINTHLILMPYGNSMDTSKNRAMELIEQYGFAYDIVDIKPAVDCVINITNPFLEDMSNKNVELAIANIRPRIRMSVLYAYAQSHSYFVVGTGNLSEYLTGYFTKWGDGAYDINPIGDFTKKEIYVLAKYLEVPISIISAKPSAELWPGQTDEDELGLKYEDIDSYILYGTTQNPKIDEEIKQRIEFTNHKREEIPVFRKQGI